MRARLASASRTLVRLALVLSALAALSVACSPEPPDIEFLCGKPSWDDHGRIGTTYSIAFGTGVLAMPWDCDAIVSLDIYDGDGYVYRVAAYVLDVEATVEQPDFSNPFFSRTVTLELGWDDIEAGECRSALTGEPVSGAARSSASYTLGVRTIRDIAPYDVVLQPRNVLLNPAWYRLRFEPLVNQGALTGYTARSVKH